MSNAADNYPIVVFWSPGDEEWIADVPDLAYCSAGGATPEEAVREVLVAPALWPESAREHGDPLPDPLDSPFLPEIAREVLRDHASPAAAAVGAGSAAGEGAAP
jgi:predicted RNase H-like HicB family nuclease